MVTNREFRGSQGDNNPIFVVGMNGSGTTMLLDSLGLHPDLYAFPHETRVYPYFISKIPSYGNLSELPARRKLANDLGKAFPFWRANQKSPVKLIDEQLEQPGFSGVVEAIMRYFAAQQGKSRWGEKSPMYVQHLQLLGAYFPTARFIHVYRDGRDVAQSVQRRFKRNPRLTIYRWKKIVQDGRSQGQQLGASRYMEVKYEELTSEPEQNFRKICSFLDLPYDQILCKSSMRQMDPNIKSYSIVTNSEKWRSHFSESQLRELESIAGLFLSELGYQVATQPGDKDPSNGLLRWWQLRDDLRTAVRHLKYRGIRSAPTFMRNVLSSSKQRHTNYY